jgi:UDP-N-acetylglucosamine 4-epimerase
MNVACGAATSLNDVVRLIGEIVGRPIEISYAPGRVGDVKHSLADIGEARTHLGYRAAVSFPEGLRRTVDWYASRA